MANEPDAHDLDATVDAFDQRYHRYLDDMAEASQRAAKVRSISTFFSQNRPFADDPVHAQAVKDLTDLAGEVTAAISDGQGGEPLARVTRLVLAEKDASQAEYWPLVALEGLAKPWLRGLGRADLQAIHRDYRRANPRWQCLPNQREIRREFERLLANHE